MNVESSRKKLLAPGSFLSTVVMITFSAIPMAEKALTIDMANEHAKKKANNF